MVVSKPSLEITAITKLRHAALWDLVKRLGGRKAAAEQIGIGVQTFDKWLKLSRCFPSKPGWRFWTNDLWLKVKENLESLTGQTIDELFPESLRKAVELRAFVSQVEQVIEVPEEALLAYAEQTAERMRIPSPVTSAEQSELAIAIAKSIKTLSYRERETLIMRYGLNGSSVYSLEEVGYIFKTTRERIRQIEAKAIRKLQQHERSKLLSGFLD